MHGLTSGGVASNTEAGRRIFRVEVSELRQSDEADRSSYPIRLSGSTSITVPFSRLNDELRRINRMGAKVVSIEPLN